MMLTACRSAALNRFYTQVFPGTAKQPNKLPQL